MSKNKFNSDLRGIELIIKALGELSNTGIVKNGLEVVEGATEETEDNTFVTEDRRVRGYSFKQKKNKKDSKA